jgi:hypothetical protein
MVTHTAHLNTFSSRGHRTSEPHIMQFPVAKPCPPSVPVLRFMSPWPLPSNPVETPSSLEESDSSKLTAIRLVLFFLPENNEGNG